MYLRARYYDPGTGQFISRDPLTALTQSPYGYAYDNPLNFTDPLGLWGWKNVAKFVSDHKAGIIRTAATAAFVGALIAAPESAILLQFAGTALNVTADYAGNDTGRVGLDVAFGLLGVGVMTRTVTTAFSVPRIVGILASDATTILSLGADFLKWLDIEPSLRLTGTAYALDASC